MRAVADGRVTSDSAQRAVGPEGASPTPTADKTTVARGCAPGNGPQWAHGQGLGRLVGGPTDPPPAQKPRAPAHNARLWRLCTRRTAQTDPPRHAGAPSPLSAQAHPVQRRRARRARRRRPPPRRATGGAPPSPQADGQRTRPVAKRLPTAAATLDARFGDAPRPRRQPAAGRWRATPVSGPSG